MLLARARIGRGRLVEALSATDGLWNKLGGVGRAGENIVIGMVDSGIWPEHPSFPDRTGVNGNATQDGKLDYQQIPGWHGKCVPGDQFTGTDCNQKLIGARYYNSGYGGNAGIAAKFPFEFNSPRDWGGHGTHTASTAGGNKGVLPNGGAAIRFSDVDSGERTEGSRSRQMTPSTKKWWI